MSFPSPSLPSHPTVHHARRSMLLHTRPAVPHASHSSALRRGRPTTSTRPGHWHRIQAQPSRGRGTQLHHSRFGELQGLRRQRGGLACGGSHNHARRQRQSLARAYAGQHPNTDRLIREGCTAGRLPHLPAYDIIPPLITTSEKQTSSIVLGHGCQTVNKTGTEDDNMDEAFLASNHAGWPTTSPNSTDKLNTPGPDDRRRGSPHCDTYRGIVLDNELRERLVNPLPAGAELLAFIETCHSGTMLDLQSKRWKRDPFTEVLAKLSATYSQFVDGIRRTRFSRLTSLDFTADPMDMITKPAKVRARSSAQKRGESYDQNYFLKSKRDYDFGDPWAVSFSATKDGKASMNNEHTMISVVIECLRAQRNARRQTTVLQLKKLVFDRLVDLRLQMLIAGNGGVEEPKWEKQLKKRLEPQVTALYPDALRYTAIQI